MFVAMAFSALKSVMSWPSANDPSPRDPRTPVQSPTKQL